MQSSHPHSYSICKPHPYFGISPITMSTPSSICIQYTLAAFLSLSHWTVTFIAFAYSITIILIQNSKILLTAFSQFSFSPNQFQRYYFLIPFIPLEALCLALFTHFLIIFPSKWHFFLNLSILTIPCSLTISLTTIYLHTFYNIFLCSSFLKKLFTCMHYLFSYSQPLISSFHHSITHHFSYLLFYTSLF